MTLAKWRAYSRLMRLDKPIGSLLLLWPTLWALWLASEGIPNLYILIVFFAGVVLMRSAGCVVNDFADRRFDGHVKRTRQRPLPSGEVTEKEAKLLFIALVVIAFALVLTLNSLTIILSLAALALAWVYPFMKRVTHLPQFVLGAAFGWSIPMSYAATTNSLPLSCWLMFLANICWAVVYDTQYAMVDRDDDIELQLKSTAILFGRYDRLIIGLFQILTIGLLVSVGLINDLRSYYYLLLLFAGCLFIYQQNLLAKAERESYFRAFMNNNYVGALIFIGIIFAMI